jgi:hypothetical protein
MLSGNKGEWSEPYALLKLLADGKLYLGDENFNKIKDVFYPIIKVLRHEKDRVISFEHTDKLIVVSGENILFKIPIIEFINNAKLCFEKIKTSKKGDGSFNIPEIEKFLATFSIHSLKAKSKSKNDITIQIEDPNSFTTPSLGFSIKSQLGRPSTLVNSSGETNFTFKLIGKSITEEIINTFNSTKLFSDKFKLLKSKGIKVKFEDVDSRVFKSNLSLFGKSFDIVLAEMLVLFSINDQPSNNRVKKFLEQIALSNPVNYDLETNSELYEMAMKQFLIDYALGMRAGDVWKRDYQASGGYIIIKKDGDIICYHFYFIKQFGDYLLNNTMLDNGSTSRNKFGLIYKENTDYKLKLNLQIRFIV